MALTPADRRRLLATLDRASLTELLELCWIISGQIMGDATAGGHHPRTERDRFALEFACAFHGGLYLQLEEAAGGRPAPDHPILRSLFASDADAEYWIGSMARMVERNRQAMAAVRLS